MRYLQLSGSSRRRNGPAALAIAALAAILLPAPAAAQRTPHNQDRPPGPALSPQEAQARFELPEGFRVELIASEPDIVNPIKMAFDERGRIWLVESLEYPRSEPGPGRDRIKVLEDTDGDGKPDRFTVFADDLNIPCGIAHGQGGVYVTNSPDVLFLKDTDGDGRADHREVIITGFGRHDTHELPNTLTWGPDGWLYGLNGVFNPARVEHKGKTYDFTCALWRWHPRSKDFELFAEGTSNPWGVGFDGEGAAFVEACVIDHLYHLTETGYYHRQGGPYPPFTWKIESIVKHRFYKAAYCGLDFYDAEVYPEEFRGLVYFGNIHGTCINADSLTRDGATYFAKPAPTILKTDDAWFMPVDIRLGPDGCFWVLDWYDRYHCYQDARRDTPGIDRQKGRLWRIVYGDGKQPAPFDLGKESSRELVARLSAANRWWRDSAQRLLAERRDASTYAPLRSIVLDAAAPRRARMQALWTLVSCDTPGAPPAALDGELLLRVLALEDPGLRAWAVRAAATLGIATPPLREAIAARAADPHADVRLQVAIAARKLWGGDDASAMKALLDVLSRSAADPLIPKIVWRNLEPLLDARGGELVAWLADFDLASVQDAGGLLRRIVDRLLAAKPADMGAIAALVGLLLRDIDANAEAAAQCLDALSRARESGEIPRQALAGLRPRLSEAFAAIAKRGPEDPLTLSALAIAVSWKDPAALETCRRILEDAGAKVELRSRALRALLSAGDAELEDTVVEFVAGVLRKPGATPREFLLEALAALGRQRSPRVAAAVLASYDALPADVRPQAIDLLCQRAPWALALLDAVAAGKIASKDLNVTQARRLRGLGDEEVTRRVTETWGAVREERDPAREKLIAQWKEILAKEAGDPWNGKAMYEKTCAQCHVLFGVGQNVGPDIAVNGRETLDLLLSNVLDPNLVIGKDYFARTVITRDGRALTGLLVEDTPQRIALRVAGGMEEVVARQDVLSEMVSPVSLMPEEVEKTMTEAEFRDLIAYLRYDEPLPEPPAIRETGTVTDADRERIAVREDGYGRLRIEARFPGGKERVELFSYEHSNDQRPFLHPLRAPGSGVALTALRPADHPWQYGVFTGHARVADLDFWHEKGWIRSRGLTEVTRDASSVRFTSRSHWLTEKRGGRRVLVEEQRVAVAAPDRDDRYAVDIEWRLTPDTDIVIDRYDYGGLAFRPADHVERRHERSSPASRRAWQDMSGRFGAAGDGKGGVVAGVAIFDHPDNPRFPSGWRVDGQGLINPAITVFEPLSVAAGSTVTFKYRLLVHAGHGDAAMLDAEHARWAPGAAKVIRDLEAAGALRASLDGVPRPDDLAEHQKALDRWAPGFALATVNADEGGIRILDEFRGRRRVLQSHPYSREVPCWFEKKVRVPAKAPRLALTVGHHEQGDWQLLVKVDDETALDLVIGPQTAKDGWRDLTIDLAKWAGREAVIALYNAADDWAWEFGYWKRIEILGE